MYQPHTSTILQQLFSKKTYQGADPARARCLFVGLDANFHPAINQQSIFPEITAYLEDGVRYWKQRGFHHPFLHPRYHGDGRTYHRQFARIGFTPEQADQISFVELVAKPTSGRSRLRATELDISHLLRLSHWILEGEAEYIFMSPGVVRLVRQTAPFNWLTSTPLRHEGALPLLWESGLKRLLSPYHLSCVGKHCPHAVRLQQLQDIHNLMV